MEQLHSTEARAPAESRAACLFHAAACGIVTTLLGIAEERRDLSLSAAAHEAALAAITTDAERRLMADWLDRLATAKT